MNLIKENKKKIVSIIEKKLTQINILIDLF